MIYTPLVYSSAFQITVFFPAILSLYMSELIFLPNFSQKDGVDELSGRGIGMDIVKENVSKLGGDVKIKSDLGKGTKLTINIKGTG